MKRLKPWIIAAMAAALTLSTIAGVSAQGGPPSIPAFFIGTVTAPEGPVATGLPVVAEIGEKRCNLRDALTFATSSEIRYAAIVDSSNTSAATAGCGVKGASVRFKVGDRYATQTATWSNTPPKQTLNLTLEPLPPPPPPPPPETVDIDLRVWQHLRNGQNIHVSARPEGRRWDDFGTNRLTWEDTPIGSFRYGDITLTVPLPNGDTATIDIRIWQHMRNDQNVQISARPEGRRWDDFGTNPISVNEDEDPVNNFQFRDTTLTVTLQDDSE